MAGSAAHNESGENRDGSRAEFSYVPYRTIFVHFDGQGLKKS